MRAHFVRTRGEYRMSCSRAEECTEEELRFGTTCTPLLLLLLLALLSLLILLALCNLIITYQNYMCYPPNLSC
jgi:hypothetical protein